MTPLNEANRLMKDDIARRASQSSPSRRTVCILAFSIFVFFGAALLLSIVLYSDNGTNDLVSAIREVLLYVVTILSLLLAVIALRRWNHAQHEIERRVTVEEQFRQLAENIDATFWLYDLEEEELLYLSPGFCSLLGVTANDEPGDWRTFLDTIHPGSLEYIDRVAQHRDPPGHVNEIFFRFYDSDGSARWVHSRIFPVADESGEAYRLVGIAENITKRRQTEEELQQANVRLKEWAERVEQRNEEITHLGEMGRRLQSCSSYEEAYKIIAESGSDILSNTSGILYVRRNARDAFRAAATWNGASLDTTEFAHSQCWALRTGDSHVVAYSGLLCDHVSDSSADVYMCIPVLSQDTPLGVLHLQMQKSVDEALIESHERIAVAMADQIALVLSNLNLRQRLSVLAIRDSLTGLYNRRYMEVSLEHEVQRVRRQQDPLGVIMMDLDNFKHFNDTYGHAAGDEMLRKLGTFLRTHIRSADIACRYGGEEFVVILPGASLRETKDRAEELRQEFQALEIEYEGDILSGVTLSAGVAVFPQHGDTGIKLLQVADDALYEAKAQGRNRLMVAVRPGA